MGWVTRVMAAVVLAVGVARGATPTTAVDTAG